MIVSQKIPLKICCICEEESIHARNFCEYFIRAGHRVDIIAFRGSKPWEVQHARIHRLHRLFRPQRRASRIDYAWLIFQCWLLVRRIRPDILNAIFLFDSGFLASLLRFHPLVLTPMGSDVLLYPFQSERKMRMARFMIRRADCIISNSSVMTRTLSEKLSAPGSKISTLLWNGINTRMFRPLDARGLRDQLAPNCTCLIYSNRSLSSVYNIDCIITMFVALRRIVTGVHLVVGGRGPHSTALMKMCHDAHIESHVTFTGYVADAQMPDYFNACDLYLTVPSSDSCASSLLEAMACGKTVVASDIPANRAWITHEKNGWLVAPRDTDSFVQTCIRAIREPLSAQTLANNRARVVSEADSAVNMEKIDDLFRTITRKT